MVQTDRIIKLMAEVVKVQVMQLDNAIRITLDLPETAIMQMAQLAECKRAGALLDITAVPVIPDQVGGRFG